MNPKPQVLGLGRKHWSFGSLTWITCLYPMERAWGSPYIWSLDCIYSLCCDWGMTTGQGILSRIVKSLGSFRCPDDSARMSLKGDICWSCAEGHAQREPFFSEKYEKILNDWIGQQTYESNSAISCGLGKNRQANQPVQATQIGKGHWIDERNRFNKLYIVF